MRLKIVSLFLLLPLALSSRSFSMDLKKRPSLEAASLSKKQVSADASSSSATHSRSSNLTVSEKIPPTERDDSLSTLSELSMEDYVFLGFTVADFRRALQTHPNAAQFKIDHETGTLQALTENSLSQEEKREVLIALQETLYREQPTLKDASLFSSSLTANQEEDLFMEFRDQGVSGAMLAEIFRRVDAPQKSSSELRSPRHTPIGSIPTTAQDAEKSLATLQQSQLQWLHQLLLKKETKKTLSSSSPLSSLSLLSTASHRELLHVNHLFHEVKKYWISHFSSVLKAFIENSHRNLYLPENRNKAGYLYLTACQTAATLRKALRLTADAATTAKKEHDARYSPITTSGYAAALTGGVVGFSGGGPIGFLLGGMVGGIVGYTSSHSMNSHTDLHLSSCKAFIQAASDAIAAMNDLSAPAASAAYHSIASIPSTETKLKRGPLPIGHTQKRTSRHHNNSAWNDPATSPSTSQNPYNYDWVKKATLEIHDFINAVITWKNTLHEKRLQAIEAKAREIKNTPLLISLPHTRNSKGS